MVTIQRMLSILFFTSLCLALSILAWIYLEGIILQSSDPNIGAGILMLLGCVLTLIFGLAWGVSFLVALISKKSAH